ncbi:MAG: glycosyltransferase family 2 protein [Deltaproteobacteria bacterium]|nr:glycosyltransferase family 2 protein [Deltaproteobacteria bacterium]
MLMPAQDVAPWVGQAVRSILTGTFRRLELVLVDDGSRDDTVGRARAAARGDSRLVVVHSDRVGISAALNRGLQHCRGALVARMDADDWCDPSRIEQQVRFLAGHSEIAVVGCRVLLHPEPSSGTGMARYIRWQNGLLSHDQMFADRYVDSVLCHATALFRREALDDLQGWRTVSWAEDIDLWLRLFDRGMKMHKLESFLYTWRMRSGATSWTDDRCSPKRLTEGKAAHLQAGPLTGANRVLLWGVGVSLERWRKALADLGVRVLAVPFDPGRGTQDLPVGPGLSPSQDRSGTKVVACYLSSRVRRRVRDLAATSGWTEGRDLFFVA